jgi:aspartyl-tRNA(Asn)/glutamyl-tRNA(Gln) amidotransferase subunit C
MRTTLHKAPCIIASALALRAPDSRKTQENSVSLDKDQVQQIAALARLKLADDEFGETVEKLSRIVDFVDQLSKASTATVVPMAHPLDVAQRLRPDEVSEEIDRDHFQENAPSVSDGLYLVPKVIE